MSLTHTCRRRNWNEYGMRVYCVISWHNFETLICIKYCINKFILARLRYFWHNFVLVIFKDMHYTKIYIRCKYIREKKGTCTLSRSKIKAWHINVTSLITRTMCIVHRETTDWGVYTGQRGEGGVDMPPPPPIQLLSNPYLNVAAGWCRRCPQC